MQVDKLAPIKKRKKINKSAFIDLANKVKDILKKEEDTVRKEDEKHGISHSTRPIFYS